MKPLQTLPCLRCQAPFERRRGRPSHFCESCRVERRREYQAERQRRIRALARDVRLDVDIYRESYEDDRPDIDTTTEWLMGANAEDVFATIADYADAVDEADWTLVPADGDPLIGARTPAGPDEGTSTGWRDLAETLDQRAREASEHPWHLANPHWAYELHDSDAAVRYLEAA